MMAIDRPPIIARSVHRRSRRWHGIIAVALLWLMSGCAGLPSLDGRTVSRFDADTQTTRLGRAVRAATPPHSGDPSPPPSGVLMLDQGRDAFAVRMLLAEAAERTLDVQYYIWRDDLSGNLLLDALRRAADRGVRVRLLLDDLGTSGLDRQLARLDAHEHIEVRLFNPFVNRRFKALGFVTDFARANRRMHNKSFTVDNQASVVGGRNVGDEYFGAQVDTLFVDLDVMAVGPVVQSVSEDFDRYWVSDSSYPIGRLLAQSDRGTDVAPASGKDLPQQDGAKHDDANPDDARQGAASNASKRREYLTAVSQSRFVADLIAGRLSLVWAPVELVSDDPAKGLGDADAKDLLWARMTTRLDVPSSEVLLVSPYFVPTRRGAELFERMARRGVDVAILTNALEATDVAVVHAGYLPWRKALLRAGVGLYEMRGQAPAKRDERLGLGSSSAESLHAKVFVVDRRTVFVGSFNFDPRSGRYNTELGFLIDDPGLAERVATDLRRKVAERSYQLRLSPQGRVQWLDRSADPRGEPRVLNTEPGTGVLLRMGLRVLSWLPIDWLL